MAPGSDPSAPTTPAAPLDKGSTQEPVAPAAQPATGDSGSGPAESSAPDPQVQEEVRIQSYAVERLRRSILSSQSEQRALSYAFENEISSLSDAVEQSRESLAALIGAPSPLAESEPASGTPPAVLPRLQEIVHALTGANDPQASIFAALDKTARAIGNNPARYDDSPPSPSIKKTLEDIQVRIRQTFEIIEPLQNPTNAVRQMIEKARQVVEAQSEVHERLLQQLAQISSANTTASRQVATPSPEAYSAVALEAVNQVRILIDDTLRAAALHTNNILLIAIKAVAAESVTGANNASQEVIRSVVEKTFQKVEALAEKTSQDAAIKAVSAALAQVQIQASTIELTNKALERGKGLLVEGSEKLASKAVELALSDVKSTAKEVAKGATDEADVAASRVADRVANAAADKVVVLLRTEVNNVAIKNLETWDTSTRSVAEDVIRTTFRAQGQQLRWAAVVLFVLLIIIVGLSGYVAYLTHSYVNGPSSASSERGSASVPAIPPKSGLGSPLPNIPDAGAGYDIAPGSSTSATGPIMIFNDYSPSLHCRDACPPGRPGKASHKPEQPGSDPKSPADNTQCPCR